MTLAGGTRINGNTADFGAGIWNNGGSVTLTGGSQINGNSSVEGGGGIFNAYGSVTLTGGSQIKGNKPDNCAAVPGCSG